VKTSRRLNRDTQFLGPESFTMKLFKCQACGQSIYFENRFCGACGHALGYLPPAGQMAAVEPDGERWVALTPKRPAVRYCANVEPDACNWLIPDENPEKFCLACRHNRTIPDLAVDQNLDRWRRMEIAKHRLFYTLISLRLPLQNLTDNPDHGLTFDFLAEGAGQKILTGHDDGLITINLNEADDALREKLRTAMGEPYRTLLGHFRHEVGHYFWDVLVRDAGRLEECRAVFGDERADYGEALKKHYADGAPANWQDSFISSYATAHPWEDFAETWAHFLHIVDTLETASAFGLRIHPATTKNKALHADIDFDPHRAPTMGQLIDAWLPLTFAVNSLNRSMGHNDLYPFIVSAPVVKKLEFIHAIIRAGAVQPKPARRRGIFGRKAAAPEQPPSPPPAPPGGVPPQAPPPNLPPNNPGPGTPADVPPLQPPVVDPPIDPPDSPPPIELPPDHPSEAPPPAPNEVPTPVPLNA
jgi:hypothetical protein